ncbi:MAG: RIP metalloprotease RseP [Firmicutes bacterium]|nr:RIP metalloprotease RseP [Bacillota bacterium]
MTAVYAIVLFVLLIFPHELGHFIVAKAVGVKVNEFAFGMGPALLQKQGEETLYSIRLIPIGGYCAMEGENEESDNPRSFNNKPGWAKISVLAAGAAMNMVIAVMVLSIALGVIGITTTTLEAVEENSPAYTAGIEAGDEIIAINEKAVSSWSDVSAYISETPESVDVTVLRDGKELEMTGVVPEQSKDGRYVIGITSKVTHGPLAAIGGGLRSTWNMTMMMFQSLKMLITGDVPASDIAGPVGIVTMVSDTTSHGWEYFASLVALMSINLAIINLLPLPALDGGRILFVFIRKITGKMISDDLEGKIHMIGMLLLFALMIFATWNDIMRLFT